GFDGCQHCSSSIAVVRTWSRTAELRAMRVARNNAQENADEEKDLLARSPTLLHCSGMPGSQLIEGTVAIAVDWRQSVGKDEDGGVRAHEARWDRRAASSLWRPCRRHCRTDAGPGGAGIRHRSLHVSRDREPYRRRGTPADRRRGGARRA